MRNSQLTCGKTPLRIQISVQVSQMREEDVYRACTTSIIFAGNKVSGDLQNLGVGITYSGSHSSLHELNAILLGDEYLGCGWMDRSWSTSSNSGHSAGRLRSVYSCCWVKIGVSEAVRIDYKY